MRLAVEPSVFEDGFSIPGMQTTIVTPSDNVISWVGGLGDEMKGPPPEEAWYGNNRSGNTAGYSSDPDKAEAIGIGNLFVQPSDFSEILEFLIVIEAGSLEPVPVFRISDREVRFGDWQVSFAPDGNFTVVRIPEPSSLCLALGGWAIILGNRSRRKQLRTAKER